MDSLSSSYRISQSSDPNDLKVISYGMAEECLSPEVK